MVTNVGYADFGVRAAAAAAECWQRGATGRLRYARSFDAYVVALLRAIAQDLVSEAALSA